MSSICPTCNSKLSCGCQKRVASNGVTVCTQCINRFENDLKAKKNIPNSNNTPQNVQVNYKPPTSI